MNRVMSGFFLPKCGEFAKLVAFSFDDCFYILNWNNERKLYDEREAYTYVFSFLSGILGEKKICNSMDEVVANICKWSKGFPAIIELCNHLKSIISQAPQRPEEPVPAYTLLFRFSESSVFKKYEKNIAHHTVPLFEYKRSGKKFSQVLSEITGRPVPPDTAREIFGLKEDAELYIHQMKAIKELRKPENKVVIVATPNASGKTEIGLLTAIDIIVRDGDKLILVVYPTRALARDQFDRWKARLKRFVEKILGDQVEEDKFYLSSKKLQAVLLDGDTVKRLDGVLREVAKKKSPMIVLTNPQFLLSTLQNSKTWKRYFGTKCLSFLVLDEIHFYRARDLTLLLKILSPSVLSLHICRDQHKNPDYKVLILSATMGKPDEFCQQLSTTWNINSDNIAVVGSEVRGERGRKDIYLVKVNDDGMAESIVKSYIEELIKRAEKPEDIDKTIIFVPNRNIADRLTMELRKTAYKQLGEVIIDRHLGDMALWERERVERLFKEGKLRVLITVKTLEVGIDIGDVKRVVHWGLPASLNDMIQREGRAGRRPGEYESIIIIRTSSDEKLVTNYIKLLSEVRSKGDLESIMKYTYTPIINSNAMFLRRLDRMLFRDRTLLSGVSPPLEIPKTIPIPLPQWGKSIELNVSFYGQDRRRFRVVSESEAGRKLWREVRIEDMLYRYLPGSIRPITGVYIVRDIDLSGRKVIIDKVDERSLRSVWERSLIGSIDFCLDVKKVKNGEIFTVSDVETIFEVHTHKGDPLDLVIVKMRPRGVKLIRKYEVEVPVKMEDGSVKKEKIPIFKLCGYKTLSEELGDEEDGLVTSIVTRGVYIPLDPREVYRLLNVLSEKKTLSKISSEDIGVISYMLITDYIHYALHILLNIASDISGVRVEDLEHYINVVVDNEAKLKQFILNLLQNKISEGDLPLKIEVVIANEVDLVERIARPKLREEILELKRRLESPRDVNELKDVIKKIIPYLYVPRCFHEPATLEYLLEHEEGESLREIINDLKIILELSDYLAGKVIQRVETRSPLKA
jgi:superfamily II DNA/RNA helicase